MASYQQYNQQRRELIKIAEDQIEVISSLELDVLWKDTIKAKELAEAIIERLSQENLNVLIMGEFSAGKSTFINALLGEQVLPAKALPTTAIITEIRYSDEKSKRVILHPFPGKWKGGDNPFTIDIKELPKYVTIDHNKSSSENIQTPFKKLELLWPLDLCRNNVEIVDSPGLNDANSHDKITIDYLPRADAIIYCMNSSHAGSRMDLDTIDFLRNQGYCSIFFVISCFDRIVESARQDKSSEDKEFVSVTMNMLAPLTNLGSSGISFVSSTQALQGKLEGNEELLSESNIPLVENKLEQYLVNEKGRAKHIRAITALNNSSKDIDYFIKEQLDFNQTSLDELEAILESVQKPLANLRSQSEIIIAKVEAGLTDIRIKIDDWTQPFLNDCIEKIPTWIEEYQTEAKVSKNPLKIKKSVESVAGEYVSHIQKQIKSTSSEWGNSVLSPKIEVLVKDIFEDLEGKTKNYNQTLQEIRIALTFDPGSEKARLIAENQDPSVASRLGALAYGLLTQDWINAGMTSVFGFKGLLRSLATQLVGGILLGIASLFTPVGWIGIGTMVTTGIVAAFTGVAWNFSAIQNEIKANVIDNCMEVLSLGDNQVGFKNNIKESVNEQFTVLISEVKKAINEDISLVEDGIKKTIGERKQDKFDIDKQKKTLLNAQKMNDAIKERLSEKRLSK